MDSNEVLLIVHSVVTLVVVARVGYAFGSWPDAPAPLLCTLLLAGSCALGGNLVLAAAISPGSVSAHLLLANCLLFAAFALAGDTAARLRLLAPVS
jgi:thiosulfate reductase cytochrome b subunit